MDAAIVTASMASGHEFLNMGNSSFAMTVWVPRGGGSGYVRRKQGGPRADLESAITWSWHAGLAGYRTCNVLVGSKSATSVSAPGVTGGAAALHRMQ